MFVFSLSIEFSSNRFLPELLGGGRWRINKYRGGTKRLQKARCWARDFACQVEIGQRGAGGRAGPGLQAASRIEIFREKKFIGLLRIPDWQMLLNPSQIEWPVLRCLERGKRGLAERLGGR